MWLVNAWTRLALQLLHRIWSSSGKHPRPSASDDNNSPQSWNWQLIRWTDSQAQTLYAVRYLTFVAWYMKAAIERYDTNRFLFTWLGHYRFSTHTATGCKFSVKQKQTQAAVKTMSECGRQHIDSLVKIFDAMILIGCINRKRHPIQAFSAYNATETTPTIDERIVLVVCFHVQSHSLNERIRTDGMACRWHVESFPKLASYKRSTSPTYSGNPLHSTVCHRKRKMVSLVNLFGIGSKWNILCDRFAPWLCSRNFRRQRVHHTGHMYLFLYQSNEIGLSYPT